MFHRFAVYYLPEDPVLAAFGASWLGWDIATGTAVAQSRTILNGRLPEFTEAPRKYGFHGTVKAPFRLSEDLTIETLDAGLAAVCRNHPPVSLEGLIADRLGPFLALVPIGDTTRLDQLAFTVVRALDAFRAPLTDAEISRRRPASLTTRQNAHLAQWGYPYVGDDFRFHMTLTGPLDASDTDAALETVGRLLPPLSRPFVINSLALVGERADGTFARISRYPLVG